MKRVSMICKMEIARMELVNARFIAIQGNAIATHLEPETINKNLFIELFYDLDVEELFAQKIYSRN